MRRLICPDRDASSFQSAVCMEQSQKYFKLVIAPNTHPVHQPLGSSRVIRNADPRQTAVDNFSPFLRASAADVVVRESGVSDKRFEGILFDMKRNLKDGKTYLKSVLRRLRRSYPDLPRLSTTRVTDSHAHAWIDHNYLAGDMLSGMKRQRLLADIGVLQPKRARTRRVPKKRQSV
jgi:hypothetical protein